MFEIINDDNPVTVLRKRVYVRAALQRWRFLSSYDLSTVRDPGQLCSMISARTGMSETQVKSDIAVWMRRHAILTR